MNKEALIICVTLINKIERDIFLYEKGIVSDLFKETLFKETEDISFLIEEIKKYILPKLYYIKETIEKGKKINKSKSDYGDYIVKNWQHESTLGLELMKFYKLLF
ncbi:MAG: hypothetical protein E7350_03595 [Clostridiales bacterium]|nr:hypothetical protein [Clostridiales bacterium]